MRFRLAEPLESAVQVAPGGVGVALAAVSGWGGGAFQKHTCSFRTEAGFGVISDLDDTVVRSNATNVLKMAWIVVRNNAHTRLPFEGVERLLCGAAAGRGKRRPSTRIFYVSSSPWNIYDLLEDFLDVHRSSPLARYSSRIGARPFLASTRDYKLGCDPTGC